MKKGILVVFLFAVMGILTAQDFQIERSEIICTAPYEQQFSVKTLETGYTYDWYLLGLHVGNGASIKMRFANATTYKLEVQASKGEELVRIEASFDVVQTPLVQLDVDEVVLCPEGEKTIFSQLRFPLSQSNVSWQKNDQSYSSGKESINVTQGGVYKVVYDNQGCLSLPQSVEVFTPKIDALQEDITTSPGASFSLGLSAEIYSKFDVSVVGINEDQELVHSGDVYFAIMSDTYEVLLIAKDNTCSILLADRVEVLLQGELSYPNAFTPNGDGINDYWEIEGLSDYPRAEVRIISRWNSILYKAYANNFTAWDGSFKGQKVPQGTYYFVIQLNDSEKSTVLGNLSVIY